MTAFHWLTVLFSCALLLGCPPEPSPGFGTGAGDDDDDDDDDDAWPDTPLSMDPEADEADATFVGEQELATAGSLVLGLPDLDGDGLGEVLIAADKWDHPDPIVEGSDGQGRVYIFFGSSLAERGERSLADADVLIDGTLMAGKLGHSATSLGDLDGDGKPELLLGRTGTFAGASALLFRGSQLTAGAHLEDEEAWAIVSTEEDLTNLGSASALLGPIDESGEVHVAIGASRVSGLDENGDSLSEVGETYIFSASDLMEGGELDVYDADVVIQGHHEFADCGKKLFPVGDFDGDGYTDLGIGSYRSGEDGLELAEAGRIYLVSAATLAAGVDIRTDEADAWLRGDDTGVHAGFAMTALGDLDGDGASEMAISAPLTFGTGVEHGTVYILSGLEIGDGGVSLETAALLTIHGAERQTLGESLSSSGDVDGDGLVDLLIGAPNASGSDSSQGLTFLFTAAQLLEFIEAGTTEVSSSEAAGSFLGGSGREWSGHSVSIGPDSDGDRLDDLIIGAWKWNDDEGLGSEVGRAYLVSSRYESDEPDEDESDEDGS